MRYRVPYIESEAEHNRYRVAVLAHVDGQSSSEIAAITRMSAKDVESAMADPDLRDEVSGMNYFTQRHYAKPYPSDDE